MKQFLLATALIGYSFVSYANNNHLSTDTVGLANRVTMLEKQVAELNTKLSELQQKNNAFPVSTKPKQLVIERRGSKQAIYQ